MAYRSTALANAVMFGSASRGRYAFDVPPDKVLWPLLGNLVTALRGPRAAENTEDGAKHAIPGRQTASPSSPRGRSRSAGESAATARNRSTAR